jgi:hypothetical protein
MSAARMMAHICVMASGDQTCSLILQRGQTINAGTLLAKDDKESKRVGPRRSSPKFFYLHETSVRNLLTTGGIQSG